MNAKNKPEFIEFDGIKYCCTHCPFFNEVRPDWVLAKCIKTGRTIEINELHLAHCQDAKEGM